MMRRGKARGRCPLDSHWRRGLQTATRGGGLALLGHVTSANHPVAPGFRLARSAGVDDKAP